MKQICKYLFVLFFSLSGCATPPQKETASLVKNKPQEEVASLVTNQPEEDISFYVKKDLTNGISISIPRHWQIKLQNEKPSGTADDILALNEAVAKSKTMDTGVITKNLLIAYQKTGAKYCNAAIDVNLMTGDLRELYKMVANIDNYNEYELDEISKIFRNIASENVEGQGATIISYVPPKKANGFYPTMKTSFEISSADQKIVRFIEQIIICPNENKMIIMDLGCLKSENATWLPILDYIKSSLVISN